jgi:hypothetical protein
MEYWSIGRPGHNLCAPHNAITPLLHHFGYFSRAVFLSGDAHGALFSAGPCPHGYKFAWLRYRHVRAFPALIANPRRPRVSELRRNGARYEVSRASRFPLPEHKFE